jgi:hypothetical protein
MDLVWHFVLSYPGGVWSRWPRWSVAFLFGGIGQLVVAGRVETWR